MHVTDIPVIDRLTDPVWREIDAVRDELEEGVTNLIITAEDMPTVLEHSKDCGEDCSELAGQLEGLAEAVERAYWARDRVTDLLTGLVLKSA